ncbi:SMC-Scp complex subunit ScpB [Microlunatus soli]|uniref:Segregation and condensation protein B n=1 Tax=Microlunatus soli TaxID=630515 RepID=A0A1H1XZZ1_9ACTN|nr:segregation and condensation protein B [Microlunatus soli]
MTDQYDEDITEERDPALRQAQGPGDVAAEVPDEVPTEEPGEVPTEESDRVPTEESVETPTEGSDGAPAERPDVPASENPAPDEGTEADDASRPEEPMIAAEPTRTPEELQSALEALLLVADEPISETALAATLNTPTADVTEALGELVRFYDETGRGFELRAVAGGWRYYTREQHAELLSGYVLEGQHAKLSQAALETLAVIAYLQPVSRSRVSGVRGVSVDGVMRTLLTRDLITEIGSEDSGATLFATTDYFLERMGLQSLDELPEIAPYLPEATELEAELGQLAVVPDPEPSADNDALPDEPELGLAPDDLAPDDLDQDGVDQDGVDQDGVDQESSVDQGDAVDQDEENRA